MRQRRWLRALTALLAAALSAGCGGKGPDDARAGEDAAADDARAGEDAAAADASVDAVSSVDAAAAEAAHEVGTAADVAEGASPADGAEAAHEVAEEGVPVVPGLAPAMVERLLARQPGCIGLGKDARALLSIGAEGSGERLLRLELAEGDAGFERQRVWPLADVRREVLADAELRQLLAERELEPCEAVLARPPFTLPKDVPVTVTVEGARALVAIDGNRPVPVELAGMQVVGGYYAARVGAVLLRLAAGDGVPAPPGEARRVGLALVGAAALGDSRCVPRPVQGKAPGETAPPPFDAAPAQVSCVAMSAVGDKAAFKVWQVAHAPGAVGMAKRISWFGPGATPAVDLACLATKCSPEQAAALGEAAARAGLVGCTVAKGAVAIDGLLAPVMYRDHAVRLQGGSGWRPVLELLDGSDERGKEALWKMFQHPAGGPIYLYLGFEEASREGAKVVVLDDAALGLCPKAPEGTLRAAEVRVSSARHGGAGYRYGATQLVDGDVTTSWQPLPEKRVDPWVELVLEGEREVAAVEIANGFQRKDGNGDLFVLNARAAVVVLTFSDGSQEKARLGANERGLKRLAFTPRRTRSVHIAVMGAHRGTRWPDEVALSEVRVLGK